MSVSESVSLKHGRRSRHGISTVTGEQLCHVRINIAAYVYIVCCFLKCVIIFAQMFIQCVLPGTQRSAMAGGHRPRIRRDVRNTILADWQVGTLHQVHEPSSGADSDRAPLPSAKVKLIQLILGSGSAMSIYHVFALYRVGTTDGLAWRSSCGAWSRPLVRNIRRPRRSSRQPQDV